MLSIHRSSLSKGSCLIKTGTKISSGNKGVSTGNVHKRTSLELVPMEIKGSDIGDPTSYSHLFTKRYPVI
jgi:hypothetical protein